ncbi:MAG TPA: DUF4214 domain-containing protein, partial [Pyrinomonadaceae bacterium]
MFFISPPRVARAAAFTPGNLVVVRVGTGSAALGSGSTAVFLDEYTLAGGSAVQSIALPTADSGSNQSLTVAGSSTADGGLNRSYDGRYLTLAGYDAAPGVAAIAGTGATTNRVVARVDSSGTIDTTTRISDAYSGANIRSAVTNDGTGFWTSGSNSGIRFVTLGSTGTSTSVSTTVTNTRVVSIQPGYNSFPTPQLYVSAASGTFQGVSTVGSGLPTTAQTTTQLPGFPTATGPSSYAYIFFDLNAGVAGVDTLYVADDRTPVNGGGIQKWTYDGTTWTLAYTLNSGEATGMRGLTGTLSGTGVPVLWATTTEASQNRIVRVTDTGAASTFTTLATAATNTAFRGIAFAPTAAGGPTASDGNVSGRVMTSDGRPLSGVVMQLDGSQSSRTITDSDGRYFFTNVEPNGFYVVTPSRVNYGFTPGNISFSQIGSNTEAVFTASPMAETENPLDTDLYFVRQQYLDFLGREPDQGGLLYWTNELEKCGSDASCLNRRRNAVSAAFFMSDEFEKTGSFVYRIYKAGLGRQLSYQEFSTDRSRVQGGANLEPSRAAFAGEFVERAEFQQKYQTAQTASSFVDALIDNIRQASGVELSGERGGLIGKYEAGGNLTESRSLVLREIVENPSLKAQELNSSFVLMEYFGYLKRDPDEGGYQFWLNVLNNKEPGNFKGMVCSFITS